MLMDCSIISALANLVYNAGIQPNAKSEALYETEDNIDKAAKALGLHSDEKGWYASVFEVVWNYIDTYKFEKESEKDIAKQVEMIKISKDKTLLIDKLISMGYAIRILVGVNKQFFADGREHWVLWNLVQYKGTLNHFVNITDKFLIDNYSWHWKHNFYTCWYKQVLKELCIGNNHYLFIRKV